MTNPILRRLTALLLLLLFAGALAPGAIDAAASAPAATPTAGDPCSNSAGYSLANAAGMSGMMTTPMAGMPMTGEVDLMVIDMLIAHHQAEVALAQAALVRAEHAEVRDLAQTIVTDQQSEIDQLRSWRDAWYPGAAAMPMAQMIPAAMGMMAGMPGNMGGMMATPYAGMLSAAAMTEMMDVGLGMQRLCGATGPFDQAFLQLMIARHQGAVALAQLALASGTHPELKQFAQRIVDLQGAEIVQMQGWLASWYGGTPAAPTGGTPAANEVDVTLAEFTVTASQTVYTAGQTYHFVVTNAGKIGHEFMVMPQMPGMGNMDMSTLDQMSLGMIPVDDLPPGTTKTIDITFPASTGPATYELVCAVPGHYNAGMHLTVLVNP